MIHGRRKNFFELKKDLLTQIMFFDVKNSISLNQRTFFWINKTFFNSNKFSLDRVSKKCLFDTKKIFSGWKIQHPENSFFSIHGQGKNFIELKKVLLIEKNVLWSKKYWFFQTRKHYLNQQNFLWLKKNFFQWNKFVHCYKLKKSFFDSKKFFDCFFFFQFKKWISVQSHKYMGTVINRNTNQLKSQVVQICISIELPVNFTNFFSAFCVSSMKII